MTNAYAASATWTPRSSASKLAMCFWAKIFTSYQAVYSLCYGGFGKDAIVLVRTMFEAFVAMGYILKNRRPMIPRYRDYAFVEALEALELFKDIYPDKMVPSEEESCIRGLRERAVAKHKYNRLWAKDWSDKNLREMARAVDPALERTYYPLIFPLASQYAHARPKAIDSYWCGAPSHIRVGPSSDLVPQALYTAIAICMMATEVAAPFVTCGWGRLIRKAKVEFRPFYELRGAIEKPE